MNAAAQTTFARALAIVLCCAAALALAQAKPAAPAAGVSRAASSDKRQAPEAVPESQKEPGAGRQLAQESKEAAGEEGDEFRQSPSVRWLARATGMSPLA